MPWQPLLVLVAQAVADPTPIDQRLLLLPRSPAESGTVLRKMAPDAGVIPREAAALVLLYPQDGDSDLWLLLTVRSKTLTRHGGEVSLPGGAVDPDDDDLVATALRETHEELGIAPADIEVWGNLSTVYISASNFLLTPVVGFLPAPPLLSPCSLEIEEVFSVPLGRLLDPATVVVEEWTLDGTPMLVPYFALHGHKVWGATALVLSELVAKIRQRLAES
ncbi:MAG: CoA pyrophosphatase [Chloroflexaceae bacterium]|nr:CoA pyrophosphatase [Chloroflexaceae bacterium]